MTGLFIHPMKEKENESHLPLKIKKSLDASWKEGIPAAIMLGIMDYYLIPYGLFLGATAQEIGFLIAFPNLIASIAQLLAVKVVRLAGSRLKFLIGGTCLQAAILIPLALLSLFPFSGRIKSLIIFMTLFKVLGNLVGTAWGSLVSDYLAPEKRGHYLGWRSQIVGIAAIFGIAVAGTILFFTNRRFPAFGFLILFLSASLLRFFSSYLMSKMVDLPSHAEPGSDFTFLMFLRRFRQSNFVKYVLYVASITFAVHMASPYFSVYMLRDLKFNYLSYMSIHLAAVMMGLVAFPIWGKHADIIGNAKILKILSFLIPLIPFLWLFSTNPFYLIGVEMFSGFIWGGFNLCTTNFIYDAVSPAKRVRCLGYFNLINGIAICSGASLGGFLAERLPNIWGFPLLTLFLLSGVIRYAAHFLLSRHFSEVRKSAKAISSLQLFFSVLGVRPVSGLNREWNVFPTPHQLETKLPEIKD
ncbi:MAG: MFS transporter [Candidatus Omnitrophica bacterium]|nr:MFS transporter [Candidatus Omnitrophota bacterium]